MVSLATPILPLRQHDDEGAVLDGGGRVLDVEGAFEADGARKAAELALDEVIRLLLRCGASRGA